MPTLFGSTVEDLLYCYSLLAAPSYFYVHSALWSVNAIHILFVEGAVLFIFSGHTQLYATVVLLLWNTKKGNKIYYWKWGCNEHWNTYTLFKLMFTVVFFIMKIECNNILLPIPQFWQYTIQKKEHCWLLAVKLSNNISSSHRNSTGSLCF